MAGNTASESMLLGKLDLVWSSAFLQPEWNFLNHLLTVLWSTAHFAQQMFCLNCFCHVTLYPANWHIPKYLKNFWLIPAVHLFTIIPLNNAQISDWYILLTRLQARWLYQLLRGRISWKRGDPEYNTKVHLVVRLWLWRVWNTPWLPLFLSSFWLGVIVIVRVPSISQIDLCKNYSFSIGPYAKKNPLKK